MIDRLRALFKGRCPAKREADLQLWIDGRLEAADMPRVREFRIDRQNRIDFALYPNSDTRIGLEVKTAVSADTIRQLRRYAETGAFDTIVLIATVRPPATFPAEHNGIPFHYIGLATNNL